MFCCGKTRCKVCDFVEIGSTFKKFGGGTVFRTFHFNNYFDCDSSGVVYLITCSICAKQYVGSTITPFRMRFNIIKVHLIVWKGQRGICDEHLYAHFYEDGHLGLENVKVQIIVSLILEIKHKEKYFGQRN